ncbi:MAG: DUF4469 domain-containing protein [Prevotellaceae bacterium]|jgi:hypothetical protein|nr:DUF4469 domain-containing protein [Prevotellaceae bacterium]
MATTKKIHEWLFYLIENTVTKEEGDKIAKVKSKKTKSVEDIAEHIVQQRTEYRKDTIVNIIKLVNSAKLEFLLQGEKVNDGISIFEPAITGNFYDDTNFVDGEHSCIINSRVTNDVHAMLAQVKGTYNGLSLENGGASIDGISDSGTGATNGEVTPGKTITITGNKIRVVAEEGETTESCITYTNTETQQVITQEDPLVINDPSRIVLQLPGLTKGSYLLTIKTLFSSTGQNLKAPRYINSKINLTVL